MARKTLAFLISTLFVSSMLFATGPPPAQACGSQNWYLPEGYTGGNFDTYVLIQNPNDSSAEATVRFLTDNQITDPLVIDIAPNSRYTVKVDDRPGLSSANVSTMVEATHGVVVERAMYFNYPGGKAGGSNSIGARQTSRTWYLAEGYTGGDFDTYILVMNPNQVGVHIRVKFITPKDAGGRGANATEPQTDFITKEYDVSPMRRFTIHADEVPGLENTEVSAIVESVSKTGGSRGGKGSEEVPGIIAERAMYFSYMGINGGHCSIGAPSASNTWYLPEGRTAGEYDTYVMVMNPNSTSTKVKTTFMVPAAGSGGGRSVNPYNPQPQPAPEPDETITKEYTLEPYERHTIAVDKIEGLEATDIATMVQSWSAGEGSGSGSSCNPVVVERSMYFSRGNNGDGHNTIGATGKYEYWFMAEGYTAGGFDTWILVQNPNAREVEVRATFMKPEGEPIIKEYTVKQASRLTILVDEIPGLESTEVSTKLQVLNPDEYSTACEYGIIAERAMYFEYNGFVGGHCSLGVGE
ncbi:MAG: hypothetical protein JJE48_01085 [Actinobacteria bacterium]|nr:hypothetical protein [Actinomycetota bacterium]